MKCEKRRFSDVQSRPKNVVVILGGTNTIKLILQQRSLRLDFDASFEGLSAFKPLILIYRPHYENLVRAKLQLQNEIMHQNQALILWHLCHYGKISFRVLVLRHDHQNSLLSGKYKKKKWTDDFGVIFSPKVFYVNKNSISRLDNIN